MTCPVRNLWSDCPVRLVSVTGPVRFIIEPLFIYKNNRDSRETSRN